MSDDSIVRLIPGGDNRRDQYLRRTVRCVLPVLDPGRSFTPQVLGRIAMECRRLEHRRRKSVGWTMTAGVTCSLLVAWLVAAVCLESPASPARAAVGEMTTPQPLFPLLETPTPEQGAFLLGPPTPVAGRKVSLRMPEGLL